MTTEKSYWGKSREGKTKQVKFKMLFDTVSDEAEVTMQW